MVEPRGERLAYRDFTYSPLRPISLTYRKRKSSQKMLQVLQSPRTYAEPDSIGALTLGNCAFVVASVNSSCQFELGGLLTSSFPVSKEKAAFLRFPPGEFGVWAAPSDSRQMLFCHFLYYARWSPFDTQPNFSISSSLSPEGDFHSSIF